MNVAQAIANLGIDADTISGDLCFVTFNKNGKPKHWRYGQVENREITSDIYLASGTFSPGSINDEGGRKGENVVSVLWLVIDCDFKDAFGIPKEELWEWSDGDLNTATVALSTDLKEIMELIDVPLHRVDYTGYGVCGYVCLGPNGVDDFQTIRAMQSELIERINTVTGKRLADPAAKDAGTRVTRLAPCLNTKGGRKRESRILWQTNEVIDVATLGQTLKKRTTTTVARAIPKQGTQLPPHIMHSLIDVIAKHWSDGQRHGLALAVAGILAKAGISEEQALLIIEYSANTAGDLELDDRLKAVRTSYTRARMGLETRGLYGLRDWLPVEAVEWIDHTLDEFRSRPADITITTSDVEHDNTPKEAKDFPVKPIPDQAKHGLIGEYIELMKETTEASEGYHLGVVLTLAGAMIGRNISVNYGSQVFANLYTLLVGISGKPRKDTAIKRGTRFLTTTIINGTQQFRSGVQIVTDVASAEGLIGSLSEYNNILLYLTEFSRLMGNAGRKGTTTIVPVLMEAFDTPTVLSNLSKGNPLKAEYPYTSILSATQPRILENLMSDEYVHSGFINRFLIIPGESDKPISWPVTVDSMAANNLYEQIHGAIHQGYVLPFIMDLAPDARSFWDEWYCAEWNRKQSEDEAAMRVRHPVLVIKIAIIYAVMNGDQAITVDHLERAISIIEWMWEHVARMVPGWGGTIQGRIETKLTQLLIDHGPSKKRFLIQYCRSRTWSTSDVNVVIEAMYKGGVIHIDSASTVSLRND